MNISVFPIETDRLLLRQVQPGDLDAVYAYQSLPEVARYCMWEPRTREQVAERMSRWIAMDGQGQDSEGITYAITLKSDNSMIGDAGLMFRDREARQAELGYVLHPDYFGQGYTSEAVAAVMQIGFEKLNMHRLFARCDARNIGSWKVMEKLGMKREAHFKEHAIFKGGWDDEFYYGILEDDWRARRRGAS